MVDQLKFLRGAGKGVNAIRLEKPDRVLDFRLLVRPSHSLEVETSRGRRVLVWERKYALTNRGVKGLEVIKLGHLVRVPRPPLVVDPFGGEEEPDELSDEEIEAELAASEEDADDGA
jgi:hypothetical protein